MKNLRDVVKSNMCLGCGLCTYNPSDGFAVNLIFSSKKGYSIPETKHKNSTNAQFGFEICPAKGYPIISLAKKYHLGNQYELDLGYYNQLFAVSSTGEKYLKNASSSGFMTILADYLLEKKIVDKVVVTGFEYTSAGPRAYAYLTDKSSELIRAQGSKYCPVDFSRVIKELKENEENLSYAVVGTPCQIAGIRNLQSKTEKINIKYYIGNFCGGFKSYNNLNKLIKLNKSIPGKVEFFRFRGGGQPGSLRIESNRKVAEVPYPDYVKTTGFTKVPRCHFCVDATAELADFACGDAWLPRYMQSPHPWSFIITRTKQASEIMHRVIDAKRILSHEVSKEDVIKSQTGNLNSKKYRQASRMKLYRLLHLPIPAITEGYSKEENYSLGFELNVFISHRIKWIFEKLNMYKFFYYRNRLTKKVLFRFFKDIYE
jgi:coenzyme F420 hydrogenase subunit beta